jgi:hypothetical protein
MDENDEYSFSPMKYFKNKNKQRPTCWVLIEADNLLYGRESGKFVHFEGYPPILIDFIDDVLLPSGNSIQVVKTKGKHLNKWSKICGLEIYGPFVFKSEWIFSYLDIERLF